MNKEKRKRAVPAGLGILVFILAFILGVVSKFVIGQAWSKGYSVEWNDDLGTLKTDLAYGEGDAQKFDLYLPKDNTIDRYGLVVYLHAGGFSSGDKSEDKRTLAWLCSKGYVAAGINYTLASAEHPDASVFSQSNEIKAAIPIVVAEAAKAGFPIDKMTVAGGSAGHALAMIYAYRDGKEAPVPVVFTYGAVGPSCFYQEDWGIFGLDQNDAACASMFGVMAGVQITEQEIRNGAYLEKVKPISGAEWVCDNPVPTVVAYGTHDRIQPFLASLRLKAALEANNVDFKYFELPHSGHGLQNDNVLSRQWMEAVVEYLNRYMPL